MAVNLTVFLFSSRRRHTRSKRDWTSDVCSSDLPAQLLVDEESGPGAGPVGGFAQVVDVVDDDDGRAAQAGKAEFEEELLQLAQVRDEHLAFIVDEEVGLPRVRGRERALGQVVDEVRGRAEGVLDRSEERRVGRERDAWRARDR